LLRAAREALAANMVVTVDLAARTAQAVPVLMVLLRVAREVMEAPAVPLVVTAPTTTNKFRRTQTRRVVFAFFYCGVSCAEHLEAMLNSI
jgi:hypothetical protein